VDKLTQYLNASWLIESSAYKAEFAIIFSALKAGNIQAIDTYLAKDKITSYATSDINAVDQYELSDANLPDNSIAVLSIQGTLYSWKTYDIENYIRQAINNPRIVSILLFVNTPGGMVHRIDIASNLIKNSPKPIDAFVTGVCCSGGMWLVSGCRNIMAASKLDIFGSIGVMTNFYSLKKYWEDLGIVDKDIYATKSTKKNYESRQLEDNNNEKPTIEMLDYTNNLFHEAISQNMGIPIDDNSDVFKGAFFRTEDAINNKLVHNTGTFEEALKMSLAKGLANKANSIY